jgi:hypothetical protein
MAVLVGKRVSALSSRQQQIIVYKGWYSGTVLSLTQEM